MFDISEWISFGAIFFSLFSLSLLEIHAWQLKFQGGSFVKDI
jgi:hypothetical protein